MAVQAPLTCPRTPLPEPHRKHSKRWAPWATASTPPPELPPPRPQRPTASRMIATARRIATLASRTVRSSAVGGTRHASCTKSVLSPCPYSPPSNVSIGQRDTNVSMSPSLAQMSSYISELCDMVPSCGSLPRRPDKLTILRMAVSHMRQLRLVSNAAGVLTTYTYRPHSCM